jgi:hypothetical protein
MVRAVSVIIGTGTGGITGIIGTTIIIGRLFDGSNDEGRQSGALLRFSWSRTSF